MQWSSLYCKECKIVSGSDPIFKFSVSAYMNDLKNDAFRIAKCGVLRKPSRKFLPFTESTVSQNHAIVLLETNDLQISSNR